LQRPRRSPPPQTENQPFVKSQDSLFGIDGLVHGMELGIVGVVDRQSFRHLILKRAMCKLNRKEVVTMLIISDQYALDVIDQWALKTCTIFRNETDSSLLNQHLLVSWIGLDHGPEGGYRA
jgi:hypothetical protein